MALLETSALTTHHLGPFALTVAAGECVGITGPSGAGKSLFLRAIADLDPHEGAVCLDGKASTDFSPREWRSRVGYLPAESAWWDDTVGEHFQNGAKLHLDALGLPRESLGWAVARLSTGERQRLALARLLERRPEVLLLDEPTGALDAENALVVEALLQTYRRENDAALVWVSHDAAQLDRVADRVLILESGRLRTTANA